MVALTNTFVQEKDLPLDKAIHMCQAREAAKKQRTTIQQGTGHLHDSVPHDKVLAFPYKLQSLLAFCFGNDSVFTHPYKETVRMLMNAFQWDSTETAVKFAHTLLCCYLQLRQQLNDVLLNNRLSEPCF